MTSIATRHIGILMFLQVAGHLHRIHQYLECHSARDSLNGVSDWSIVQPVKKCNKLNSATKRILKVVNSKWSKGSHRFELERFVKVANKPNAKSNWSFSCSIEKMNRLFAETSSDPRKNLCHGKPSIKTTEESTGRPKFSFDALESTNSTVDKESVNGRLSHPQEGQQNHPEPLNSSKLIELCHLEWLEYNS